VSVGPPEEPTRAAAVDWHVPQRVLAGYAVGLVDDVDAWSVESHLGECLVCRDTLSAQVDGRRLARNRATVLGLVALPELGRFARVLDRLGVPEHMLRLLTAAPSLRRSWLLSVLAVVALLTGEAALARWWVPGHSGQPGAALLRGDGLPTMVPLLIVGPLLVLASVAVAYVPLFDPSYRLTVAAPFSWFTLLLVRTVSAVAVTLVPVVCAAFVVPGPGWLPAAVLLPSLALCALALATGPVVGQAAAPLGAGAVWVATVLAVTAFRSPLAVVDWLGQALCAGVLVVAAGWLFVNRDRLEVGWAR
jgi:hypothetical protein